MIDTITTTAVFLLAIPATMIGLFLLYMPMHLLAKTLGFRR
jgi:hypothetical protein